MRPRRPPTPRGIEKQNERERAVGLDSDDDAARWLAEHDPPRPPSAPNFKSKELHRGRQRQQRKS